MILRNFSTLDLKSGYHQVGKFSYACVDDVITVSQDEEAHIKHVERVLKSLQEANIRVSVEKSRFFFKEKRELSWA